MAAAAARTYLHNLNVSLADTGVGGTEQLYETLTELGKTVRFIRLSGGHLPNDRDVWNKLDTAVVNWFRGYLASA